MYRVIIFLVGLAVTALALPIVLTHHERAELMALAWCSSSGSGAPQTGLFGAHCAACPALILGLGTMLAAWFVPLRAFARKFVPND
ncbi:hypothetical protein [Henriciella litoralis]|uniref:hypothetical protein n=1 Tax=Henriciella litoralis TaxID=568102 RepID=UPI000A032157|nr:hypothetical protein [Henriciella litoralis]